MLGRGQDGAGPVPMMTGAGSGFPAETTVVTGSSISATGMADGVSDWSGKNSLSVPDTVTSSPAATVGRLPVNTAMPCLNGVPPTSVASCMKNSSDVTSVTTPGMPDTAWPANGDSWPPPSSA